MPYYLDNAFLLDNPWITVVGCGGTGGFVAEGLCRLFQGRQATIVLVDHDRVEPHNLLRQNFYAEDVGSSRARPSPTGWRGPSGVPSATRSTPSGRRTPAPMGAATPAFPPTGTPCSSAAPTTPQHAGRWRSPCRATRAGGSSTRATTPTGARYLIGNVADRDFGDEQAFVGETCYLLPAPTLQRPDLLTAVSTTPPDVDCAAALDLTDQDPTINQMMASLVLQVVRRMAAGTCPFMGLYLDMEQGNGHPDLRHPGDGGAGGAPTPSRGQRPRSLRSRIQSENNKEKPMSDKKETPRPPRPGRTTTAGSAGTS